MDDREKLLQEIRDMRFRLDILEAKVRRIDTAEKPPEPATPKKPDIPLAAAEEPPRPKTEPTPPPQVETKLTERNLGKYGVGILAGVLVLLAVVVGASTIWEAIPDWGKLAIIVGAGIGVEVFGWFRISSVGIRNGFWTSVTATGAAVSFVGVVVGALVWKLYGVIPTGIALVVWFGVNLFLSARADSIVFYIITYIGGSVSIFLAAENLSWEHTLADEAGLLVIIAAVAGLGIAVRDKNPALKYLNYLLAGAALASISWLNAGAVLEIGRVVIALLLLYEGSKLFSEKGEVLRFIGAVLAFAAAVIVAVYSLNITRPEGMDRDLFLSLCAVFAFIAIPGTALFAGRKPSEALAAVSPVAAYLLLYLSERLFDAPTLIPAIALLPLALIPAARKNRFIYASLLLSLAVASVGGCITNTSKDAPLFITAALMTLVPVADAVMTVYMKIRRHSAPWCLLDIAFTYLTLYPITRADSVDIEAEWLILAVTTLMIACRIIVVDREEEFIGSRVMYGIMLAVIHLAVWNSGFDFAPAAIILISHSVVGVYESIRTRERWMTVLYALLLNVNVFWLHYEWSRSDPLLAVSVAGIIIAAGFIALGFVFRHKDLRLLGLVTLMIYTLKITFYDVPNVSGTGLNILLILGSGLVLFAVSFAYNRLDKMFSEKP